MSTPIETASTQPAPAASAKKTALSRDLGRKESYTFACPRIAEVAGDGPVRFCGHCNKEVINLSSMTAEEAEDLLTKQGQAPSCVQVNLVNRKVVHQPSRGGALRKMTLAIGLGLGGVALAQWALTPAPATAEAAMVGGGAAGAFSGAVIANQTAALHRSIEAAIADAQRIGQPVPEFTPPPPDTPAPTVTPPPPGDPNAPPSADPEPTPCEPEPEMLGGDIDVVQPLGGVITPPTPLGGRR